MSRKYQIINLLIVYFIFGVSFLYSQGLKKDDAIAFQQIVNSIILDEEAKWRAYWEKKKVELLQQEKNTEAELEIASKRFEKQHAGLHDSGDLYRLKRALIKRRSNLLRSYRGTLSTAVFDSMVSKSLCDKISILFDKQYFDKKIELIRVPKNYKELLLIDKEKKDSIDLVLNNLRETYRFSKPIINEERTLMIFAQSIPNSSIYPIYVYKKEAGIWKKIQPKHIENKE